MYTTIQFTSTSNHSFVTHPLCGVDLSVPLLCYLVALRRVLLNTPVLTGPEPVIDASNSLYIVRLTFVVHADTQFTP